MAFVHQAIYGDKSGSYALLKTSLPDTELAKRICNVTDLLDRPTNGILTQPVFRAFSFNEFYLFMKSFPDSDPGIRRGRVLSHTLIVEQRDLIHLKNLEKLFSYFISEPDKNPDLQPLEIEGLNSALVRDIEPISREAAAINGLLNHAEFKNTLIWVGEKDYLSFIAQIWPQLNGNFRTDIKFGIGFYPQKVDIQKINILYIPEEYANKWHRGSYCIIKNTDSGMLESMASSFIAGDEDNSKPLHNLIDAFGITLNEIEDLVYLEKVVDIYKNLSLDTDFNRLIVLCDLVSKYSQHQDVAKSEKERLLKLVKKQIERATAKHIIALKNVNWTGFSNVAELLSEQLYSWMITNLFSCKEKEVVTEIIVNGFDPKNKAKWWRNSILKGLNTALENWKPEYAYFVWNWFATDHTLVNTLGNLIPATAQIEADFASHWIKPKPELARKIQEIALKRKWFTIHGLSVLQLHNPEEAILRQLEIDSDSEHYLALQRMSEHLKDEEFIGITLRLNETRLIKISGKKISHSRSLLDNLDIDDIVWQKIWIESLDDNSDPWIGISSPYQTLTSILDSLIDGKKVHEELLIRLAQTSLSDLSSYPKRKEVWQYLQQEAKLNFVSQTVKGLLEKAEKDFSCLLNLESELLHEIRKQALSGVLLASDKYSGMLKVKIINSFDLGEKACISFIQKNTTTFSFYESEALGELIDNKKWKEAAKSIKDIKWKNNYLEPAWNICGHLIPRPWWEWKLPSPNPATSTSIPIENKKTTILFLTASPKDQAQLNLSKEIREIEDGFEAAKFRDHFELKTRVGAKFTTFKKAILDERPEIIHFSGHGHKDGIVFEYDDGKTNFIEKEVVNQIFSLLKDEVKCVVLNACYSEEQAKSISEYNIYVVGMSDAIDDDIAIAFSIGFYQSLGAGRDYKFSFEWALSDVQAKAKKIDQKNIPHLWLNGKIIS